MLVLAVSMVLNVGSVVWMAMIVIVAVAVVLFAMLSTTSQLFLVVLLGSILPLKLLGKYLLDGGL